MANNKKILFAILFLAAILRLSCLSRGDVVNDEVFYGFRAIGMMDFDSVPLQPTPWEWTDPNVPAWAHLSFHDHPPLVFAVQHLSMSIFGANNFGMRFPSAVFGILSVWLVYLIGKRLFSERAGLLSALIYAVTINAGYISRLGIQEVYVVFFVLAALHVFLKALKDSKHFIWLGVILGLAFLTKYTTFVLVPIFLAHLIFYPRDLFRDKKLWLGIVIAIIIFSPVIFYNYKLYQLKGHFDFQFSNLLGQNTPEWKEQPGKEIGTLAERFKNLPSRIFSSNSWLFIALFLLSAIFYMKEWKKLDSRFRLVLPITFFLLAAFIMFVIGPSYRFLSMLSPFMALIVGWMLNYFYEKYPNHSKLLSAGLIIIVIFEIFYFYNNLIAYYPAGPKYWLNSPVRTENPNLGYNEFDDYLGKELSGKMPALTFSANYKFLEDAKQAGLAKSSAKGFPGYPALIVYGGEWNGLAKLWVLDRRRFYEGWPILSVQDYFRILQEKGFDFFDSAGFSSYYFIWPAGSQASDAEKVLMQGDVESIYNPRGEEVCKIYKF